MAQSQLHTPSDAEIMAGIAAGRRERSEALWAALSGFGRLVKRHFEWREDMRRIAISGRCPNCSC